MLLHVRGNTVSMDFIFDDMKGDNREMKMNPFVENPMWKAAVIKSQVISGSRTTGDGYCESCIAGIEGNQAFLRK